MVEKRLSSDNLYHFKSDVDVLKLILKYGFRHNLWRESIPYKKSEQDNFMVCFCDIKIEDSSYHRQCYGDNAIVLKKEWGIRNGITPVRYIHENSPGISSNYISSKNRFREIRKKADNHDDTISMDYSIFSVLLDSAEIRHDSIEKDIMENNNLKNRMQELENEFLNLFITLKKNNQDQILAKFIRSLINRIYSLHNELEIRDSHMRIYSDNFASPSTGEKINGKILYDEKEWRSIKHATKEHYNDALHNGFLQQDYNLTFSDNDVLAILPKDQDALNSIQEYLKNNQTLLNANLTISKLGLIDKYNEN